MKHSAQSKTRVSGEESKLDQRVFMAPSEGHKQMGEVSQGRCLLKASGHKAESWI